MRNRHRVVWTKGMFLTPQQFQTQDHFFEAALQFRLAASCFANWGVTGLDIDAEALQNGLFRLAGCSGIMPDGESFDMPDIDDLPPSRAVASHFPPTQESLDVFLGIPESRPRARNVSIPGRGISASNPAESAAGPPMTRYLAETRMFTDENTGDDEKPVQVARRTFRVLFGDDYRDGYSTLRIAQVIRNAAGIPILNPRFVAPCLSLAASPYLNSLLRRQIEILATKSGSLSGPRRQRGKITAEFSPSETANFWLLHTVNSYLPELKHIWKVRKGHPEPAYVAMLRLAGALATFSLEARPENLPDYDHDDLGRCFTLLDEKIRDLMETVIPSKFVAIPLDPRDRFIWGGTVTEDRYFRDSQFFLAISAKIGVDDLIRKVPQLVKISSNEDIQRLIRNALPGITLRHTPVPPAAIPMKLDSQYFSLNQSGELWNIMTLSRQISVHVPGEIIEPRMEILIVLE
jgi:type VI secretion system protein ImpJ